MSERKHVLSQLSDRDYLRHFEFSSTVRYEVKVDPRLHILISSIGGKIIVVVEAQGPDGKWELDRKRAVPCRSTAEAVEHCAAMHRAITKDIVERKKAEALVTGPSKVETCRVCQSNPHKSSCPHAEPVPQLGVVPAPLPEPDDGA